MTDAQPTNRVVHEDARLQALRDEWMTAANAANTAWTAFLQANRRSPLRRELDEADARERATRERYSRALQQPTKDHENGE